MWRKSSFGQFFARLRQLMRLHMQIREQTSVGLLRNVRIRRVY